MGLDSGAGVVMVAVPPSRTLHTVRFEQFRCLRLLAPLAPTPEPAGAPPTALTAQRPALPFSVAYKDAVMRAPPRCRRSCTPISRHELLS